MIPYGNAVANYYSPQNPAEVAAFTIGDTVLSGDHVVDSSKIRKVPLLYHPEYLVEDIKNYEFYDLFAALTTGAVQTPITKITDNSISRYGNANGFDGPGILVVSGEKLVVESPGPFVWGIKTPYTYAVKTKNGLEIKTNDKTVKTVSANDINNNTIPHNYVNVKTLKTWYNSAAIDDKIALDFALGSFNDGRNMVTPDKIKTFFGDSVVNYMENYPSGSPVFAYIGPHNETVVGTGGDTLGSYPQYPTAPRAYNAYSFAKGWNGTIIPPHTAAHGKETVGFEGVIDPHAPDGSATHGVCPAARALRGANGGAGFPLPIGMAGGELAVLFGFNPTTGILVNNTGSYPVKIVMWTSGSGASMHIYAKMIALKP